MVHCNESLLWQEGEQLVPGKCFSNSAKHRWRYIARAQRVCFKKHGAVIKQNRRLYNTSENLTRMRGVESLSFLIRGGHSVHHRIWRKTIWQIWVRSSDEASSVGFRDISFCSRSRASLKFDECSRISHRQCETLLEVLTR